MIFRDATGNTWVYGRRNVLDQIRFLGVLNVGKLFSPGINFTYELNSQQGSFLQAGVSHSIFPLVENAKGIIRLRIGNQTNIRLPIDTTWQPRYYSQIRGRYTILVMEKAVTRPSTVTQFTTSADSVRYVLQGNQRYGQGWSGTSLDFAINTADAPTELQTFLQTTNARIILLDSHPGNWAAGYNPDGLVAPPVNDIRSGLLATAQVLFDGQTFGAVGRQLIQGDRRNINVQATDGLGSILAQELFEPSGYYFTLADFVEGMRAVLDVYDIGLIANFPYRHSHLPSAGFHHLAFATPARPLTFTATLEAITSAFSCRAFLAGGSLVLDFITPDVSKPFHYYSIWSDSNGIQVSTTATVPFGNINRESRLNYPITEELIPEASQVQASIAFPKRSVFELEIKEATRTGELTNNFPQLPNSIVEVFTGNAVVINTAINTTPLDFFIGRNDLMLKMNYAIDTGGGLDIFLWRLELRVDGVVKKNLFRAELDDRYKEFSTTAVVGSENPQGKVSLRSQTFNRATDLDMTPAGIARNSEHFDLAPLNRYNFGLFLAPDADSPFHADNLFKLDIVRALTGMPLVGNYTFGRGSGTADEYGYDGVLGLLGNTPALHFFEDDQIFENTGIFWDDVRAFHGAGTDRKGTLPLLIGNREITESIVNRKLQTRSINEGYGGRNVFTSINEIKTDKVRIGNAIFDINLINDGDIILGIENSNPTVQFVRKNTTNRADATAEGIRFDTYILPSNPRHRNQDTLEESRHANWWQLSNRDTTGNTIAPPNTLRIVFSVFQVKSEIDDDGNKVFTARRLVRREHTLTNAQTSVPEPYEVSISTIRTESGPSTDTPGGKVLDLLHYKRIIVKPRTAFLNYMYNFVDQLLELITPTTTLSTAFYFKSLSFDYSLVQDIDYGVSDTADISRIGIKAVTGTGITEAPTFLRTRLALPNAFTSTRILRREARYAEYYTPSELPNSDVLYWTGQVGLLGTGGYEQLQDGVMSSLVYPDDAQGWQANIYDQRTQPLLQHLAQQLLRLFAPRRKMRKGKVFVKGSQWQALIGGRLIYDTGAFDLLALLLAPNSGVLGAEGIALCHQLTVTFGTSPTEDVVGNFISIADASEVASLGTGQFVFSQFDSNFDI